MTTRIIQTMFLTKTLMIGGCVCLMAPLVLHFISTVLLAVL